MADKEINIKVTANTDDAKKGIAEVTNELEKMNTSGSGKAADELDKVTEAADKAGDATDKLVSSWAAYKQNVREAEAEVRKLNATQFENAEQRDAAINALGDKLDALVYEGKAIEDSVKAIGISPESLQGFDSITATLNRANKEFEIALNYKEKLLNQPTAPANALVQTNPWEEGPDGGGPAEFKARMEEMREELEAYAAQMGNAIAANDQMKSALEAELASLDKSSAGYAEQKKLLEGLISACDSYAVSSETQRQSIQKQKDSLDELNKETLKSENWEEGLKSLDKYGEGVVATSLKVQKSVGSQIAIQNRYENAVLSAQQKELKGQVKLQAQMEMAGKSREELIRLVEEYGKALANAQTKEEYEAAAAGISAARKQLTTLTREASLTGSAMIGSQTSVQGLVTTIGRLGAQGRLTFKALSDGIKLFAKSTLVLAGIQFAWEALSKIYEKVKGDIFGVAEAEERAAERAEALAEAAQKAGDELKNAQIAFAAWKADQDRADAAKQFSDALKLQNDYYIEQVRLVNEATAALLRQAAATAKGDEHEIALERLKLQEQKMKGLIDEYEYQEKLVDLESRAAEIRRNANVEAKALTKKGKADQLAAAKDALAEAEMTPTEELGLSPAELKAMIAAYQKDEAKIQQYEGKYEERETVKRNLQSYKDAAEKLKKGSPQWQLVMSHIADNENRLAELNDILNEVDGLIIRSTQMYKNLPANIKDAQTLEIGLAEYSKDYAERKKTNEAIEKQQEKYRNEIEKLQAEYDRATLEWENATEDAANAASQQGQLAEQKIANIRLQRDNEKAREENEKRIESARNEVENMEYSALKKQAREMRAWAELVGENTPEGKNRRALAAVYSSAYQKRKAAGKEASLRVGLGLEGTDGKEGKVIKDAQALAARAGSGRNVALERVAGVLEQALKTSGSEDDVAAQRLYEIVSKLVTVTDKNARQMRSLKNKYEALKKKTANLDA